MRLYKKKNYVTNKSTKKGRITSYNVCYTKLLRIALPYPLFAGLDGGDPFAGVADLAVGDVDGVRAHELVDPLLVSYNFV